MRVLIAAAALSLLPSLAMAADFTALITDPAGAPISDDLSTGQSTPGKPCGEPGDRKCLTLGLVAQHALLLCAGPPYCPDEQPKADEKFRRGMLGMQVEKATNLPLSAEDVAMIKMLIGKLYGPLVISRAWPLLDPAMK